MKQATSLLFISLQVQDFAPAKAFYHDLLGFELAESPNPEAMLFRQANGATFAVRKPLAHLPKTEKLGLGVDLWFQHAQLEELQQQALKTNVPLLSPLQPSPFGPKLVLQDPDGYAITLHEGGPRS